MVAILGLVLTSAVAAGSVPSLDEIRAAATQHAAAVSRVTATETLEQLRSWTQTAQDQLAQRLVLLGPMFEQEMADASAKGASAETLAEIKKGQGDLVALLEKRFAAQDADNQVVLACKRWQDASKHRVRFEQVDGRDCKQLAQQYGMTPTESANLDLTQTVIALANKKFVLRDRGAYAPNSKTAVQTAEAFSADMELLLWGVAPAALLNMPAVEVQSDTLDGAPMVKLVCKPAADGPGAARIWLSVGDGLRARRVEFLGSGGVQRRFDALDYRPVGDTRVPFQTRDEVHLASHTVVTHRNLVEIALTCDADAAIFTVPAGYQTQTLGGGTP